MLPIEKLLRELTPREGAPNNPRAWLTQVAFRRMADQVRRDSARRTRETELVRDSEPIVEPDVDVATDEDDTLVLLFMCCHPALTSSSAIALTLRAAPARADHCGR